MSPSSNCMFLKRALYVITIQLLYPLLTVRAPKSLTMVLLFPRSNMLYVVITTNGEILTKPAYIDEIQNMMLFRNLTEAEMSSCLKALDAYTKDYRKGSFILRAGDSCEAMGIVLSGSVTVESSDLWGNRSILTHIGKHGVFAEVYALIPSETMGVDVRANEACTILFVGVGRLNNAMYAHKPWATTLTSNLLAISTRKNLTLSSRSFHTSPKTIRERVLAYLSSIAQQKQSNDFDIPFDRQQLADYLNVDRSALSKELGKLRDEGIVTYRKNHFVLHK